MRGAAGRATRAAARAAAGLTAAGLLGLGLLGPGLLGFSLPGCSQTERPGLADDLREKPREPEASLVDTEAPRPNLQSACGAATVNLDFVRPNLYFAIDASGSMRDEIPLGDLPERAPGSPVVLSDRYGALALALQELLERVGHRVNYGATLFPSEDVACDSGEEILTLSPGDAVSFAVSGQMGPVLSDLMFSINRRAPRGGTPVAEALSAILPKLRTHGEQTYLFLVTDGGPNCDSAAGCGAETCIPNLERALISDGVVCEAPINCCDPSLFGPENCLDQTGSLLAVSALAEAGVRTFVIGIPGSDAFASVLDQLALAGGMARAGSPSYYRVGDAEQLIDTVGQLGLGVSLSCSIELVAPPPDPTLVNVFFDGQLVPADPIDGWGFANAQTVQLLGSSCELFQKGQVLQADIVSGCPVVIR